MEETSSLLAWGNCNEGQLGVGSGEYSQIDKPTIIPNFPDNKLLKVIQVACGRWHSLFVVNDGSVWSCGSNENGQLGRSLEDGSWRKPGKIASLSNYTIVQAAAGATHSMCLGDYGQVFVWGVYGKHIDEDPEVLRTPRLLKQLGHEFIIQITAGTDFNYVMSDAGFVFVWGQNHFGQLGLGHTDDVDYPTRMKALDGLPIKQIVTGGSHALILSKSGSVYAAGKNEFGQLGVGDKKHRDAFTLIRALKNQRVCYVCCGQEHSAALTVDGGVFTFGAGGSGQLGHGQVAERDHNELQPRKVFELMGSPVSQLICGRFHTLAYVHPTSKVYGFGLNGSGQLTTTRSTTNFYPTVSSGCWLTSPVTIQELFAGGDQSFALIAPSSSPSSTPPIDFRYQRPAQLIPSFSVTSVDKFFHAFRALPQEGGGLLEPNMQRELEVICSNSANWNESFLLDDDHFSTTSKNPGISPKIAWDALKLLSSVFPPSTADYLAEQMPTSLLPNLPSSKPADIECLRLYVLLPLFPALVTPLDPDKVMKVIVPFASAFARVTREEIPGKIIKGWLSLLDVSMFDYLVQLYKSSVAAILTMPKIGELIQSDEYWKGTQSLLDAMAVLYACNNVHRLSAQTGVISHEAFYIPQITDKVNIGMDYKNWYDSDTVVRAKTLSFCNYSFTFDPSAKTMLLQADSQIQMENAVRAMNQEDVMHNFIQAVAMSGGGRFNPSQIVYLNMYIDRNDLVKEALDQIWRFKPNELKRPLKIWFKGEEAEDAGGVKKEFFMLLMRELLDPKYGMFTYYEETHSIYFNGFSFECEAQFGVIGVLCGLAIYNGIIVDVHFPAVLYKKLLVMKPILQDLSDLMPTVKRSLEQLLEYTESDFETTFSLNFTFTHEYLGQTIVKELKPGGVNISVTQDNKKEYVELYVDYVLNKAVQGQYGAFSIGFNRVCGGKILELFHPQELMAMVCGNENYDWMELEEHALYKGDYSDKHETIIMFWKVFHSLSLADKKRFLLFLTGCDRIPILGMKAVQLVIQPMGDKDQHLPVAHTCFNILDLPKYSKEDILRQKLMMAIAHTEGFGLA